MPIRIEDARLNRDLDRLAKAQPTRTSKQAMAEALLRESIAFCRKNPLAWMTIGTPAPASPSAGAPEQAGSLLIRSNQPTQPVPSTASQMSSPASDG